MEVPCEREAASGGGGIGDEMCEAASEGAGIGAECARPQAGAEGLGMKCVRPQAGVKRGSMKLVIEEVADFASQNLVGEGFLQEGNLFAADALANEGVVGIAGDVEEFDLRPESQQSLNQLGAAHSGHDHVGDDQMNRLAILLAEANGFRAVVRFQHGVSGLGEHIANEGSHHGFIFDQEDGLGAAGLGGG